MKTFLLNLILFISIPGFTQKFYTGYLYDAKENEFLPLQFTKEYKNEDSVFSTIYHVYSPTKGYHYIDITATHYKDQKKVRVTVVDITVKNTYRGTVGEVLNTEEGKYDTPTMEIFGKRGSFQSMFDNTGRVPARMAVQFVSKKFENIKVISVSGDESEGIFQSFVLEK